MLTRKFINLALVVFLIAPIVANAVVITTTDFSTYGLPGDITEYTSSSPQFRVTETFTSAAERGMATNLYEYTVDNLSADLSAALFRVANPFSVTCYTATGTMNSPTDWAPRTPCVPNFLWETATDDLLPGETLSGFEIETDQILESDLSVVLGGIYDFGTYGWIMADQNGQRVDYFGTNSVSRVVGAPEPATLALLGLGLAGLGFARKKMV